MFSAVEQVVLVLAHLGQFVDKRRMDMHMTGRAGTATAASSQQFVKTIVADDFHQAEALFGLNFATFAIARYNGNGGHEFAP